MCVFVNDVLSQKHRTNITCSILRYGMHAIIIMLYANVTNNEVEGAKQSNQMGHDKCREHNKSHVVPTFLITRMGVQKHFIVITHELNVSEANAMRTEYDDTEGFGVGGK